MIDNNNWGWTFQNRDGDIIIIFYVSSKYINSDEQISKLLDIINVEFDVALNVGIGSIVSDMSKIKLSYNQARENFDKGAFTGNIDIPNKVDNEISNNTNKILFFKEKVLENFNDTEMTKKYLKSYLNEVRKLGVQKNKVEQMYYDLASAFYWEYLKTTGNSADG